MAEISVIVPVYKVEQYLRECVDSILAQSFQNFDLILVDDGSPDGCPAICDRYAESDKRVTVLHKQNGGLSDARNAGIDWAMKNSDSQWLAFVDSDDYLHPDYLSALYNAAVKESADLVVCDYSRVDDSGSLLAEDAGLRSELSTTKKHALFQYLDRNWRIVPAWNKLYVKQIFDSLRFELGKIHEDEFAIFQVLWKCRKAVILRQKLYYYRCRQSSIMATESAASRLDGMEAAILQCEFCLEHELPPRYSVLNAEYLNSVIDLKRELTQQQMQRYRDLKRRYANLYFKVKRNRTVKGCAWYYLNSICRAARRVLKQ